LWIVSASNATEPVTRAPAPAPHHQRRNETSTASRPRPAGLEGGVDAVGYVVAVRPADRRRRPAAPTLMLVAVGVVMIGPDRGRRALMMRRLAPCERSAVR
jgi:hypothetical protein